MRFHVKDDTIYLYTYDGYSEEVYTAGEEDKKLALCYYEEGKKFEAVLTFPVDVEVDFVALGIARNQTKEKEKKKKKKKKKKEKDEDKEGEAEESEEPVNSEIKKRKEEDQEDPIAYRILFHTYEELNQIVQVLRANIE